MDMKVISKEKKNYLAGPPGQRLLEDVQDALDIIGLCGANKSTGVLLYEDNFPRSFFDLKTKVAGEILQKFTNYGVRMAAVLNSRYLEEGHFGEMAREANKGGPFRYFTSPEPAEKWLLGKT